MGTINSNQQVLSQVTEVTIETSPSPAPSSSPTPFSSPKNSPLPTPTPASTTSSPKSADWQYPGSTGNGNHWQSSDSPQVITDWYKNKIKTLNLNATSFVQTNTNNNVLNKLVAANGSTKVAIEITKDASSSQTSISVNLDKN